MKTQHLFFTLFVLFVFTTGGVLAQSTDDYKQQIEKRNKQMVEYMLSGDTEKTLSLYTDDAISLPSYEPMHQGLAEIRKANEQMVASGWKFNSFEPTIVKVIPMGELVTEIGTYQVSMSSPEMSQPMNDKGKYLTIWEKQADGTLKIKIETWNSDTDPATMMRQMQQQADIDDETDN